MAANLPRFLSPFQRTGYRAGSLWESDVFHVPFPLVQMSGHLEGSTTQGLRRRFRHRQDDEGEMSPRGDSLDAEWRSRGGTVNGQAVPYFYRARRVTSLYRYDRP
jgi:hypothetical protein